MNKCKLLARKICLEEEMNWLAKNGVSVDDSTYQEVYQEWFELEEISEEKKCSE